MRDLRGRLYRHLQRQPLSFFTDTRTGEIQSRVSNDVGGVQTVVTNTVSDTIANAVIFLSTLVAMSILSWQLTLVAMGTVPVFAFLRKALDLLRDMRCTIHNAVSDRHGTEGEFKVYGRAMEVTDTEVRHRYEVALYEKIGWSPGRDEGESHAQYHLFFVDVESVAYAAIQDGQWLRELWKAA